MWPEPQATTGLLVDLYHLDAAYVSWRTGQNAPATFDLYTRSAPFGGAYLLTAGLEPTLAFVRDLPRGVAAGIGSHAGHRRLDADRHEGGAPGRCGSRSGGGRLRVSPCPRSVPG